ncbi:ubiquitin [Annulohypoxylon nitens]|nr:ubiquitin [Annulohypoxylon nitens]
MALFVRDHKGKVVTLQTKASDSVRNAKLEVENLIGIPIDRQLLHFAGRLLPNDSTLASGGVRDGSTLHLILLLLGGAAY